MSRDREPVPAGVLVDILSFVDKSRLVVQAAVGRRRRCQLAGAPKAEPARQLGAAAKWPSRRTNHQQDSHGSISRPLPLCSSSFRRGSPSGLPRFNRRVTNRVTRTHRIPVSVLPQPGGYRFALTDGADTDRVKNVPAAGGCHIRPGRHDVTLVEPGGGSDPALARGVVPRSVDPAPHPRGGIPRPHRPDTPDPAGQPAGGGRRPPHTVSR